MNRVSTKRPQPRLKSSQSRSTKLHSITTTTKVPTNRATRSPKRNFSTPIKTTSHSGTTPLTHDTPLVTTTVTDPGAITFETSFQECLSEVKNNAPYHAVQIHLFPPNQRALSLGLRALQCELDAIPEKAKKPEIAHLKAGFWRSTAEKMRKFIMHDAIIAQYGSNSPEMSAFMAGAQVIEAPAPLAPIKTLTHAINESGLGFDFLLLDNIITASVDYFPSNTFQDLPDYIKTVDQTCGNLNLLQITTGAHELQNLEELQPLSKAITHAAIQLGRVEGLLRLLTHQPLTFANNYTWLPRDLLRQHGVDPAHFVTIGRDLLDHSNKEWFEALNKKEVPNLHIRANISHEFHDDFGEEELEKELQRLRSSDPNRAHEGLYTTVPAHLRDIKVITMKELRQGLRDTNKVLHDITLEQVVKLREMQKDVPKPLRVFFFHTYAVESYLKRLKEADYDTLDPALHIWDPKTMLKLNATMIWNNALRMY